MFNLLAGTQNVSIKNKCILLTYISCLGFIFKYATPQLPDDDDQLKTDNNKFHRPSTYTRQDKTKDVIYTMV